MANNKLSESDKEFIENNYRTMTALQMAEELGVTVWCIHDYKRKNRLIKIGQGIRVSERSNFFNVHAQNWL